jgi:hypothetical protein
LSEELQYNLQRVYALVGAIACEVAVQVEKHYPEVDELRAVLFQEQSSGGDKPQAKASEAQVCLHQRAPSLLAGPIVPPSTSPHPPNLVTDTRPPTAAKEAGG